MQEVALFPLWVTVFLYIWAAVGPLAGILIGHYLTRSWQRTQRIADNRKEEYKTVLAALNRLNMALTEHQHNLLAHLEEIKDAMGDVSTALNTSLFISDFFEQSKVVDDVLAVVREFIQGGSLEDYSAKYWKSVNLILASAKKTAL